MPTDRASSDRRYLTTMGMNAYTASGNSRSERTLLRRANSVGLTLVGLTLVGLTVCPRQCAPGSVCPRQSAPGLPPAGFEPATT
jgi:hypothetical protein